jgi:aryl-alcohol dehydrogenase-like predicted oxidoreductase
MHPVGFGAWQLAGAWEASGRAKGWGPLSDEQAVGLVHAALDAGVRFFDTAEGYGAGRSEARLGAALSTAPQGREARVCSKIAVDAELLRGGRLEGGIRQRVEAMLGRLRRDTLDLLLLHGPPDGVPWSRVDPAPLDGLVQAGLVRAYGVSPRGLRGALAVADAGFGSAVEWVLNLTERRPLQALLPRLVEQRMDFIARTPLARGLLKASVVGEAPSWPADDFRSGLDPGYLAWVRASMGDLAGCTAIDGNLPLHALRWVIEQPGVSVIIPGVRRPEQVAALRALPTHRLSVGFSQCVSSVLHACYPPWDRSSGG